MPAIQALPTWSAWNNANFTSSSGITDVNTGQAIVAGGLNPGDYFDANNEQAAQASFTTNGLLYGGRYRFVQVDAGATAANVKVGTIGYMRAGQSVRTAVVTAAGSGYTPGTYYATVSGGSGSGAVVQYGVSTAGTITGAIVLGGGEGYTSVPTLTVAAPGGTGGTIVAQLGSASNTVTSADIVTAEIRPVVFLNAITPGNWGFIQELGTATVLGNPTIGTGAAVGNIVSVVTGGTGTVQAPSATTSPTIASIGLALDLPLASNLFKIMLQYVPVVQD